MSKPILFVGGSASGTWRVLEPEAGSRYRVLIAPPLSLDDVGCEMPTREHLYTHRTIASPKLKLGRRVMVIRGMPDNHAEATLKEILLEQFIAQSPDVGENL